MRPFEYVISIYFAFTVLPVISPFQFDDPLNAGDIAQLFCHVTKGDRPLKIKWYHNGKHISHHGLGISTSAFGTHTSILSISSVEPIHSGDYTCVASNVAGKAQYTTTLDVFGTYLVCLSIIGRIYF
uniref:Ig-like domain-containing protein n=1 Tax=Photinus pyralis TaxID=7054 RepID=A0A1Y1NJC7_PHOPY